MNTINPPFARLLRRIALFLGFLPLCQSLLAAVGVSLNPTAVSNTYNGTVTLQVTGLTNGETVLVQKYLDANANGVVDSSDLLWQQFYLTDGKGGMVIAVVTNFNVPGDTDATKGQITAQLLITSNDFQQSIVAPYLYVVSSPVERWSAITKSFAVTNYPFAQKFTGNVLSNGVTPLPDSVLLLFSAPRRDIMTWEILYTAPWRTIPAPTPSGSPQALIRYSRPTAIMWETPPPFRC